MPDKEFREVAEAFGFPKMEETELFEHLEIMYCEGELEDMISNFRMVSEKMKMQQLASMTEKELRACCSIMGHDFPPFWNKTSILNHISTWWSQLFMGEFIECY